MAGRARLSLSHTVLLSLSLLCERVSYRSVSRRFHLEKGNIHRIFFSFCERINTLEESLIRWPDGGFTSVLFAGHDQYNVVKYLWVVNDNVGGILSLFSRQRGC